MAGSVNKVILVGNLGADPEVRNFQNGGKVASLRLATSESWKDRQTGERQERTEWHTVSVLSDGLVGVVERYLKKGAKIYVEGQLRTRKWQDQAGQDRYSTEVVLNGPRARLVRLDAAGGRQSDQASRHGAAPSGDISGGDSKGANWADDLDDDIPF